MTNKLLTLSLLSLAACTTSNDHVSTTDTPPAPTTEMKAAATFQSMTGSTIEIYAVGEHGYFATELADVGVMHVLDGTNDAARMNSSQLYMSLTGNTDVPKALVDLDRQILPVGTEAAARTTGTTSSPLPQKPVASAGNCTAKFFQANDCPVDFGGDSYDWCILNWTGGRYAYASTVDLSFAHLCSSKGELLWQIQNGDGGFHQWSVLEGQFFNYSLHDSDETWLHYDVLQASGDIFQFGGDFLWY